MQTLPKATPNRMSIKVKGMQVWNEEDAEDEVLAMVVRTGLCTSMGSMMRQVVHNRMSTRNLLLRVSRKNWDTMSDHHLSLNFILFCINLFIFVFNLLCVFHYCT